MRKILLMRGAPGCGKSSLLQVMDLAPYALSMDTLRQVQGGPQMLPNGSLGVPQERNALVYQQLKHLVAQRMADGELIALDNTMPTQSDLEEWLALAAEHDYQVLVADFSSMPLAQVLDQNARRPGHRRVDPGVVERIHAQASQPVAPGAARVVAWEAHGGLDAMARSIGAWLDVPVMDLSGYKRVVHIGDLQGCLSVLTGAGGPLEQGFDPQTAYIFVGDLVDRGLENGALVRWFHEQALARENVFLLWGNHEDHLWRWGKGLAAVSREFRERTLPQLEEAGVTPQMAREIVARAVDVLPYTWRGTKVMACHAGLASVPARFHEISSRQYARGTGHWEDPVDEQFQRHAPADWCQVHGHRNHGAVPVQASARSFNLEDAVEFGGHLRTVVLDERGWTPGEYRNQVFRDARTWRAMESGRAKKARQAEPNLADVPPAWMDRPCEAHMSAQALDAMAAHPGVRLRSSTLSPHVNSLNFTKGVFFQASWDDVLVKARGLFVDADSREIVARGYEKFFNVGERPETRLPALLESLAWPVAAYVKENGFLGNLGFDARTQELFVASKSTPDGDFARWFREIFEATVPAGRRERIRRWLRDNEASMVLEVIDPVRDPHMIDYEAPHLVLLDVFHRSETPEKLPYEHLKAVGERFGLAVKRRAMVLPNARGLEGWLARAGTDLTWRWKGQDIEGLVLEDARGFQTKVKLPHYAFWKRMRSATKRLAGFQAQLEAMADDGLLARKQGLLSRMAEIKETLSAHRGQGEAAQAAKQQLRTLGRELGEVSAQLAGKDRRERVEEQVRETLARDPHPLAQAFLGWCSTQPAADLQESSILALRSKWMAQAQPDPSLWSSPWEAFSQDEEDDAPARTRGPGIR